MTNKNFTINIISFSININIIKNRTNLKKKWNEKEQI